MAAFSGNVVSAKFIDFPENMTIEVLYHENDIVVPYILGVDFTQPDFNDLLKEITLEDIQANSRNQIEAQGKEISSIFNAEIERRWALEEVKIKAAYDQVDKYTSEIIKAEYTKVENAWQEIEKESNRIKDSWEEIETASGRIEGSWKEIETASGRIEGSWKEIEKESGKIEGSWKEIEKESGRIEGSWKELETATSGIEGSWKELETATSEIEGSWKEIEEASGRHEKYAENEKSEFYKLRQELALKFNTGNSANKIEAKDILLQLMNKAEDKDFVFNMKVAMLEDPDIAKSKDKDMKLAIRKAKSPGELLRIYYSRKLD